MEVEKPGFKNNLGGDGNIFRRNPVSGMVTIGGRSPMSCRYAIASVRSDKGKGRCTASKMFRL